MIEPDFSMPFEHENGFYLTCNPSRIGKFIAHYELYKRILNVPGAIVECGVFKGASLSRFAMFRQLLEGSGARQIIGFDIFGEFPETSFAEDKQKRAEFIASAGRESITPEMLDNILKRKGCGENVQLIAGDICTTVPSFVRNNTAFEIALLNLDTDIYEPAVTILQEFWPRLVKGGVLLLDDYGVFPGETKAVDDYFKDKNVVINQFGFAKTPAYIIKN
jgi:hypothetical protein